MADTAGVTSIDDNSPQPPDSRPQPPDSRAAASPEPAPRKPLNSSWAFTAAGGLFGAYFLISGALMVREKHGNGVFALLVAGILLAVAAFAGLLLRSSRADRAARTGRHSPTP